MKTEKKIEKKTYNFIKKNICHDRIFFQKEWLHSYYLILKTPYYGNDALQYDILIQIDCL